MLPFYLDLDTGLTPAIEMARLIGQDRAKFFPFCLGLFLFPGQTLLAVGEFFGAPLGVYERVLQTGNLRQQIHQDIFLVGQGLLGGGMLALFLLENLFLPG